MPCERPLQSSQPPQNLVHAPEGGALIVSGFAARVGRAGAARGQPARARSRDRQLIERTPRGRYLFRRNGIGPDGFGSKGDLKQRMSDVRSSLNSRHSSMRRSRRFDGSNGSRPRGSACSFRQSGLSGLGRQYGIAKRLLRGTERYIWSRACRRAQQPGS